MLKITHSRCWSEKVYGISPKPIVVAV